ASHSEQFAYTTTDLLKTYSDRMSPTRTTTFRYDSLGRLRFRDLPDATGYEYRYDARSRLAHAHGPGPQAELAYDLSYGAPGTRQATETTSGSLLGTLSLTHLFDRNGFRTSVAASGGTIPAGLTLSYAPDQLGRPS